MACLVSKTYDPATSASASTTALLAMTAIDTTNLRVTFTAPSNGKVLVRLKGVLHGATTTPQILLGVLDGATVKGRVAPISGRPQAATATTQMSVEGVFIVSGLTASQSYTWDAAYGVEFAVASSGLKYGGPDNTTGNDAFGAFLFEVWETPTILATTLYDPGTAVSKATSALLAMTAFDTTNLRLTFTAPSSGRVLVRERFMLSGGTGMPNILVGVLDGATVKGRVNPMGGLGDIGSIAATSHTVWEAAFIVDSLTPTQSYTWDAAYGVENTIASTNIKYGGPDNTTQDDAYGGFAYEIWSA
jgi:hypothetical protein